MHDSWRYSFREFADYCLSIGISDVPKGWSIDRINNDGNYEPGNIRLANNTTQANNKRNIQKFQFNGELLSLAEISRRVNIKRQTLWSRIYLQKLNLKQAIAKN